MKKFAYFMLGACAACGAMYFAIKTICRYLVDIKVLEDEVDTDEQFFDEDVPTEEPKSE